jgi:hypothetical protein
LFESCASSSLENGNLFLGWKTLFINVGTKLVLINSLNAFKFLW